MLAKNFFSEEQKQAIQQAIANAELNTSGEIRVHLVENCKGDAFESAVKIFNKLNMHKTELRNGVLFYLAVSDKKLAIAGDKGINEKIENGFWDAIRDVMIENFKKENFTEGLCLGIEMAGEKLKIHFPFQSNDTNELPNEVSFGE